MIITVNGVDMQVVLRTEKNAELTFTELDGNFTNLALKAIENADSIGTLEDELALKATVEALTALETLVNTLATQESVTAVNDALTALTGVVDLKATIESVTAVDTKVDALRQELVDAGVLTA